MVRATFSINLQLKPHLDRAAFNSRVPYCPYEILQSAGMSLCVSHPYPMRLNFSLAVTSLRGLVEDLACWALPTCWPLRGGGHPTPY